MIYQAGHHFINLDDVACILYLNGEHVVHFRGAKVALSLSDSEFRDFRENIHFNRDPWKYPA